MGCSVVGWGGGGVGVAEWCGVVLHGVAWRGVAWHGVWCVVWWCVVVWRFEIFMKELAWCQFLGFFNLMTFLQGEPPKAVHCIVT